MKNEPLVSIGLFTYNGAKTIRRAIDALLSQTYRRFELIISDNDSSDETPDICKEYAARDPRIRYIRQDKKITAGENQIAVCNEAKGDYFMWAADDDWWAPEFIEILVNGLESHPKHNIAMSSYDLILPDGTIKKRVIFSDELDLTNQNYEAVFRKMLFDQPIHVVIYGLFRKKFLSKLLQRFFPKSARHDRVLMCEAALFARIYTTGLVLFFKVRADSPLKTRETYIGDPMAAASSDPLARTRYFFTLPLWLLTSPNIPFTRKRFIIFYWPQLIWLRKRRIFNECKEFLKSGLFFKKNLGE